MGFFEGETFLTRKPSLKSNLVDKSIEINSATWNVNGSVCKIRSRIQQDGQSYTRFYCDDKILGDVPKVLNFMLDWICPQKIQNSKSKLDIKLKKPLNPGQNN